MDKEQHRLVGWIYLLGCYWFGECLSQVLPWPIPGSILGMLLLLCVCLSIRHRLHEGVRQVSGSIIPFLSLAIMPASASILNHLELIQTEGVYILVILVVSLALGMWVTGLSFQWLNSLGRMQADKTPVVHKK